MSTLNIEPSALVVEAIPSLAEHFGSVRIVQHPTLFNLCRLRLKTGHYSRTLLHVLFHRCFLVV